MQNESSGKKALRAGLGYTIGNILVKGLTFISIPIFARLLSVADYGLYNTFGSYVTIMTFVVGLTLHTSVRNAKLDFPDRIDAFCSSVTIIILLNTALLAVLSVIFAGPLARLLGLEQPYLVVLIIAEGFGLAMITFYNCLLSVDYKYKEYLVLSLLYAVCGLGLSVVLITTVFREQGYLGRILGTLVPAVLMGIYIIARMFRRARPRVNRGFWVYGLKISLPIVPHGLGQLLLAQFDRIMIKRIIGDTEAGLYSFAYNVGMIFQVITNSLDTAWTPWFFEKMEAKDYPSIRRVANGYTAFVSLGAIALMLISPEIVTILGGAKYAPSRYVAIPVVLAMYYSFLYTLPSSIEYYYKKTVLIAIGTLGAAVVNIALNAYFIPRFGYIAAAYTTVVCYLLYYAIHVFFAWKVHGGILYDMKNQLLWLFGVTAAAFIFLAMTDLIWLRMALLAVGFACAGIWALRHREQVRGILQTFKK